MVIDEPELGLHRQAITKLAALIQMASAKTQLILSTQSVNLVDCFDAEQIVTVDRDAAQNQSVFRRLQPEALQDWLQAHTLGDLWQRNILNAAQPFAIRISLKIAHHQRPGRRYQRGRSWWRESARKVQTRSRKAFTPFWMPVWIWVMEASIM